MSKLIVAPDFPISQMFLTTMSVLQLTSSEPEAQRQECERLMKADWDLALQELPAKQGKARAMTAQMLSSEHPELHTPEQTAELAGILASSLKDLPVDTQAVELQWDWDSLRSHDLRSTLEQMVNIPPDDKRCSATDRYTASVLKSIALRRWYELDPQGAREELRQIGSPKPSLTADALSFLPPEKLPQFESLWAEQWTAADDDVRETLFAELLVRFGSGSAVAAVHAKANAKVGEWDCAPQAAAMAYLVKFQPESVPPLIGRALKRKSGCVFGAIFRYATDPVLNEVALETLADSDPQVTIDALSYLTDYRDKSAEQPIWNRYVEWSEKWRGRGELLESRGADPPNWNEIGLGESLARALIQNQGWLASSDLITRFVERRTSERVRTQVKQIADQAKVGREAYPHRFLPWRHSYFQIAQYIPKSLELLEG